MLVSIVIPCYNSEHTIGKVVELAIEEFEKLKDYECEFVLDQRLFQRWNMECDPCTGRKTLKCQGNQSCEEFWTA